MKSPKHRSYDIDHQNNQNNVVKIADTKRGNSARSRDANRLLKSISYFIWKCANSNDKPSNNAQFRFLRPLQNHTNSQFKMRRKPFAAETHRFLLNFSDNTMINICVKFHEMVKRLMNSYQRMCQIVHFAEGRAESTQNTYIDGRCIRLRCICGCGWIFVKVDSILSPKVNKFIYG